MNDLEKFGEVVVHDLRDAALNHFLDIEAARLKSESCLELSRELSKFSKKQIAIMRKLVSECVDKGVHDFLFALEEQKNGITIHVDGNDVSKQSDGLQGEIFTEDGWFEQFSQHKENGI